MWCWGGEGQMWPLVGTHFFFQKDYECTKKCLQYPSHPALNVAVFASILVLTIIQKCCPKANFLIWKGKHLCLMLPWTLLGYLCLSRIHLNNYCYRVSMEEQMALHEPSPPWQSIRRWPSYPGFMGIILGWPPYVTPRQSIRGWPSYPGCTGIIRGWPPYVTLPNRVSTDDQVTRYPGCVGITCGWPPYVTTKLPWVYGDHLRMATLQTEYPRMTKLPWVYGDHLRMATLCDDQVTMGIRGSSVVGHPPNRVSADDPHTPRLSNLVIHRERGVCRVAIHWWSSYTQSDLIECSMVCDELVTLDNPV